MAETMYRGPVTVLLRGELGAGKTTFMQGFAEKLGIRGAVTSPTFALEQRYRTADHGELLHIDCYRLTQEQARELIAQSDDHPGIRCIEWPERAGLGLRGAIDIHLTEDGPGRIASVTFDDAPVPSQEQIRAWRDEVRLPDTVLRHCDAVGAFAERLGNLLVERGVIVRTLMLRRCGELHDLLRFIDFHLGAGHGPEESDPAILGIWNDWKSRYAGMRHEAACASFLREQGFDTAAAIVETHGLSLAGEKRSTIEQRLLYYADKRVALDRVVSLNERFADFQARYSDSEETVRAKIWHAEAAAMERELFPEGTPTSE